MQNLLTKIRQANPANKCALAAEIHAQLEQALENLQPLLDFTPAQTLNLIQGYCILGPLAHSIGI